MNRFFRSALFPLIIIAALVWLALQTLGAHGTKTTPLSTAQLYQDIRGPNSAQVTGVTIDPNKQSISATVAGQEDQRPLRARRSPRPRSRS